MFLSPLHPSLLPETGPVSQDPSQRWYYLLRVNRHTNRGSPGQGGRCHSRRHVHNKRVLSTHRGATHWLWPIQDTGVYSREHRGQDPCLQVTASLGPCPQAFKEKSCQEDKGTREPAEGRGRAKGEGQGCPGTRVPFCAAGQRV